MNKGRLAPLLEKIPIFLVRNQYLGVKGAKVKYLIFNLINFNRNMREEF